jgi:hypothetical protein
MLVEFDEDTGEKLSEEEQADHRDDHMRDYGCYRTRARDLDGPHLTGSSEVPWEFLKDHKTLDLSADEDGSDDEADEYDEDDTSPAAKAARLRLPWQPFPGLVASEDAEAARIAVAAAARGSVDLLAASGGAALPKGTYSPMSGNASGGSTGPSGIVVSGFPLLVGGKGTFLRMAKRDARGRRQSVDGGPTAMTRPVLVHGSPVFKYDPRYQFLRDLHAASPGSDHVFGGALAGKGKASQARAAQAADPAAFLAAKAAASRLGRAGPVGGAWWWDHRQAQKDPGAFAREALRDLEDEDGEHSDFVRTWHAAMFEVPEKRIRTVHWPLTD